MPLLSHARVLLSSAMFLFSTVLVSAGSAATPLPPSPPSQPATGPGGSEIRYTGVVATRTEAPSLGYWLFEPAGPTDDRSPPETKLPVVLFLGGCCMPDSTNAVVDFYRDWIDHLVRRGAVVVYPVYHFSTAQPEVTDAAKAAFASLESRSDLPVETARIAIVSHSYGGVIGAEYAATAAALGLPPVSAALLAMPGCIGCRLPENFGDIPESTRLLVLVGDKDTVVGDRTARTIWAQTGQIPADRRDYVAFQSDDHGAPPLIADHGMPTTGSDGGVVNALDWYGPWKLADALLSCAFADQDCAYALGDTPRQRFMGAWSDGKPVIEPTVTDEPGPPNSSP